MRGYQSTHSSVSGLSSKEASKKRRASRDVSWHAKGFGAVAKGSFERNGLLRKTFEIVASPRTGSEGGRGRRAGARRSGLGGHLSGCCCSFLPVPTLCHHFNPSFEAVLKHLGPLLLSHSLSTILRSWLAGSVSVFSLGSDLDDENNEGAVQKAKRREKKGVLQC